jgi:NADPH:quinone reductase-like Zn-dependent oxidoreductase
VRAVVFEQFGGVEQLKLAEVDQPTPDPGEVLVRVRACGLNRLDLLVRSGKTPARVLLPHISGSEVAGEIAELGMGVDGLTVGQRVAIAPYLFCGRCEFCLAGHEEVCLRGDILGLVSQGGYAEYVRAPAASVVPLPDGLDFEAAAAVSLATLTAWHMLVTRARLRPGEDVLVHAAGSGVGSAAIQVAKLAGARVIATAGSAAKLERARALGADAVINYNEQDFLQEVRRLTNRRGVDVVVEHVGQATWEKSVACLTRNGRLVSCGTTSGTEGRLDLWAFFAKQIELIGSYGGTRRELAQVLRLVAEGRLRPVIHQVYALEEAAEAQRVLESRDFFGKLVLRP